MDQLQPLIDLLSGQHGWSPAVLGWMASLRLALKPVSMALQNVFARYRAAAFLVDLLASVKLPTALPVREEFKGEELKGERE